MRVGHLLISALLALGFVARAFADECDPNDPTLLKPDLVAEPPSHVHVVEQSGHRLVLFSTTIGNVGQGPLVLEGKTVDDPNNPTGPQVTQASQVINRTDGTTCTHLAGYFIFHPARRQWNFDDFADYQVLKGDVEHTDDPYTGEVMAQADKVSFCLIDAKKLHGFRTPITVVSNCLVQEGIQGIDVGYADVYDTFLPGQLIDLDADPARPVPAGNYFLVNTANPRGAILEVNDNLEANSGVVSISVPPPPGQRRAASPRSARSAHAPRHPMRLPSSHRTPNAPGQPHATVPSFRHPSRHSHPVHPAHRSLADSRH